MQSISYLYGPTNERAEKSVGTTSTFYFHGSNSYPLIETTKSGSQIFKKVYVYGPGGLIAFSNVSGGFNWNYPLKDHLGSTRRIVNQNNTAVAEYQYSPYGRIMYAQVNQDVNYKFTGQELDNEDNLHNFRARLFDPESGIFYAADPAGQMFASYGYCGNNPVSNTDPTGQWFGADDAIIAGTSFVIGYLQHGITTGNWGKDALVSGGISAGSALLGYYTGGAAAGALFEKGTTGFALTAGTIGGAVGGASSSIGNQLYYNGKLDWNSVGKSTFAGAAGGFAGSYAGSVLNASPTLSGMIGGAVSGGIEGGFEGAFNGAWWGGVSGALTNYAYVQYGKYLTNKMLGEGAYGNDYAGETIESKNVKLPTGFEDATPNKDLSLYDCSDFVNDYDYFYRNSGRNGELLYWESKEVTFDGITAESRHFGVALGRTPYGQVMVLNKIGAAYPILVATDTYLRNIYGNYKVRPWSH